MTIVDSSGWLEFFAGGERAGLFAEPIRQPASLVVPTVSIYEVFRKIYRDVGEAEALRATMLMRKGMVVALSDDLAMDAARLGAEHRLPFADSVIYATALAYDAEVWTQDADFEGLPRVRFFRKG